MVIVGLDYGLRAKWASIRRMVARRTARPRSPGGDVCDTVRSGERNLELGSAPDASELGGSCAQALATLASEMRSVSKSDASSDFRHRKPVESTVAQHAISDRHSLLHQVLQKCGATACEAPVQASLRDAEILSNRLCRQSKLGITPLHTLGGFSNESINLAGMLVVADRKIVSGECEQRTELIGHQPYWQGWLCGNVRRELSNEAAQRLTPASRGVDAQSALRYWIRQPRFDPRNGHENRDKVVWLGEVHLVRSPGVKQHAVAGQKSRRTMCLAGHPRPFQCAPKMETARIISRDARLASIHVLWRSFNPVHDQNAAVGSLQRGAEPNTHRAAHCHLTQALEHRTQPVVERLGLRHVVCRPPAHSRR